MNTHNLFGEVVGSVERAVKLGQRGFIKAAKSSNIVIPPAKYGSRKVVSVDSFAGGGGASNGVKLALESLDALGLLPAGHALDVDFAVNHDEPALAMHAANHPSTIHLPHNVWKVSMLELLGDNFFGLLWLSPDCRDHSNAKGGPITSRSVRDLAWVLVRWLKELPDWQRPWCIFLENVPAFAKWSPLVPMEDGSYVRDKNREGEIFARFVKAVSEFGYSIGWDEMVACEHGDPTIRKRLHMVFRRDLQAIEWPSPTHGDPMSDKVLSGELEPWPVAADIIDFDRPCPSIFMTKQEAAEYTKKTGVRIIRPLAEKTDARIAKGVHRHALNDPDPFIVTCNHGGEGFRGQSINEAFRTVASARDAHGLVVPHLSAYYGEGRGGNDRSAPVTEALRTIPTEPRHALIAPHIVSFRGDQIGRSIKRTLATVTANSFIKRPGGASPLGMASTALVPFISHGQHGGRNRSVRDPHHTVAASTKDQNQVIAAYVAQHNGGPRAPVGRPIKSPLSTTTISGSQQQLVSATFLKRDFGKSIGSSMRQPIGSVTAGGGGKTQLMAAHMLSLKGSSRRDGTALDPHPAICAGGQHSAVVTLPLMTAYYSTGGQHAAIDSPMLAVPTKARFGLTEADAAQPPLSEEQLDRARMVAAFLRKHGCWDDREFVTVTLGGDLYVVVDIGMRMLTPRELARAQGFPDSYILAAPYKGGTLSETEQRHKIGNSVCRRPAAALIIANYRPPLEWGEEPIPFMEAAE